jgi:hypothetical protein
MMHGFKSSSSPSKRTREEFSSASPSGKSEVDAILLSDDVDLAIGSPKRQKKDASDLLSSPVPVPPSGSVASTYEEDDDQEAAEPVHDHEDAEAAEAGGDDDDDAVLSDTEVAGVHPEKEEEEDEEEEEEEEEEGEEEEEEEEEMEEVDAPVSVAPRSLRPRRANFKDSHLLLQEIEVQLENAKELMEPPMLIRKYTTPLTEDEGRVYSDKFYSQMKAVMLKCIKGEGKPRVAAFKKGKVEPKKAQQIYEQTLKNAIDVERLSYEAALARASEERQKFLTSSRDGSGPMGRAIAACRKFCEKLIETDGVVELVDEELLHEYVDAVGSVESDVLQRVTDWYHLFEEYMRYGSVTKLILERVEGLRPEIIQIQEKLKRDQEKYLEGSLMEGVGSSGYKPKKKTGFSDYIKVTEKDLEFYDQFVQQLKDHLDGKLDVEDIRSSASEAEEDEDDDEVLDLDELEDDEAEVEEDDEDDEDEEEEDEDEEEEEEEEEEDEEEEEEEEEEEDEEEGDE